MTHGEGLGTAAQEPSDAEIAAYVAEICTDLARLSQREGFATLRYLLGLARMEAEKLTQHEDDSLR